MQQLYAIGVLCFLLVVECHRTSRSLIRDPSLNNLKKWETGAIAEAKLISQDMELLEDTKKREDGIKNRVMSRAKYSKKQERSWDPNCSFKCDSDCLKQCQKHEFTSGHCVAVPKCSCQCE